MTGEDKKSGFAGLSALIKDVESAMSDLPQAPKHPGASGAVPPRNPSNGSSNSARPAPVEPRQNPPRPIFPPHEVLPRGKTSWPKILFGMIVVASLGAWLLFVLKQQGIEFNHPAVSSLQQTPTAPAAPPPPVVKKIWAHVTAERANVRAAPSTNARAIGSLSQLTQVEVVGWEGTWTKIKLDGSTPNEGFVSSSLLHEGSAAEAKALVCDVAGSVRPRSGEVLSQSRRGQHKITVSAGDEDTLVKLRSGRSTALSFYVRANERGVVTTVPDGTYTIMFASGTGFSRKCLEFVTKMDVISDPNPQVFEVTSDGRYRYTSEASYTLTQVVGGNLRPRDTNPDAFRE